MISVNQLSVFFGDFALFDKISFIINPRDRIGLAGKNGAGKSTLISLLAGTDSPTGGDIIYPKDCVVGHLPQHMRHVNDCNLLEETKKAFAPVLKLQEKLEDLNKQLSERDDYESESYMALIDQITHLNEHLAIVGLGNFDAEIEKILLGLGFERSDFGRNTGEFSGGWRMRVELAKLLLQKPDLLLLDEPTNHLDIESIQWLEAFLVSYPGAILLVSHDKTFLDAVCSRTIEISLGKIYDYKAPYTKYLELRKERREQQLRAYENQQKEIKATQDFIERFRYKATKAVQVQSRIKHLERMEVLTVDEEDSSRLNLRFPPAPRSGTVVVEVKDYGKAYDGLTVLKHVNMVIERGEKVAFVGRNGEGKTTLVKSIMNELDFEGKARVGHQVMLGYFAQNQAQLLDPEQTVFDTIDCIAKGDVRTQIRNILGAFMFGGDAVDKKVKVLSGGERSRLAMIRLLLEPVNLLILDEPTNHLDIQSKEVLKQALMQFDGTVILVSHDRYFLDGLVDKVYEFKNQGVRECIGGIDEFLKRATAHANMGKSHAPELSQEDKKEEKEAAKLSYEERKERSKALRKVQKEHEQVEADIARCEAHITSLDQQLLAGDEIDYDEYNNYKGKLEQLMEDWELLANKIEAFE